MLAFLNNNILLCVVGVFFNRRSAYIWVQTVLFSLTYFLIPTRQPSYKGFSIIQKEAIPLHVRYIDDVISLNNYKFGDFVDRIYPIELEIKVTTDTARSAS